MVEGDLPHSADPPRRRSAVLGRVLVLVVVLALVAAAAVRFDLLERWGPGEEPDPRRDPAAVEPPAELELPSARGPRPVAAPLDDAAPDAGAVRRAVGRLLEDPRLGRSVGFAVAGIDGRPVVTDGPGVVTPASTLKLLTCLAALATLGSEQRFTTTVVADGRDVTLVGGGDPLLARRAEEGAYPEQADLATLAADTAEKLLDKGHRLVRLGYDESLFTGPSASPDWEPDYLPDDVVSPISALWVDQGRVQADDADRSADPAADAARFFVTELRRSGVRVVGPPTAARAPQGAEQIAVVRSAELAEIVQHVLEISDNEASEVLARHVAVAEGVPASFAGAGQAVAAVVERLGVPVQGAVILDGSGLARGNQLAVRTLLETLAVGAAHEAPELGMLVEGLPVAGFSGSLGYRFATGGEDGLGRVRAKTGTLVAGGVHGLAGLVTAQDGTLMLFVVVADQVKVENTLFVRDRLDQVAAALAGCACAA